ncbi:MAG: hypothetical protein U0797_04930 [Gemmataceae bacterium]
MTTPSPWPKLNWAACGLFGEFYCLRPGEGPAVDRGPGPGPGVDLADPQHLDYNPTQPRLLPTALRWALMEKDPSGARVQFQQCLAVREEAGDLG